MTLHTVNYAWPYPEDGDAPDGPGQFEALADAIDASLHTTDTNVANNTAALNDITLFTSYTPTWSMDVASGTKTGHYIQIGNLIICWAAFTGASGVSLGTGPCTFTVPAAADTPGNNQGWIGSAAIGGGAGYVCDVVLDAGSSTAALYARNTLAGQLSTPGAAGVGFASGNYITAFIIYRKA